MASPYDTSAAQGSGNPYDSGGASGGGGGKSFKVKKEGRGNFIDRSWDNIKTIATKSVPGAIDFAIDLDRAIVHDIVGKSFNPLNADSYKDPYGKNSETRQVVAPFVKDAFTSTVSSFRHPFRDPVYTLLNATGVASLARGGFARGGAAAAEAAAVEGGLAKTSAAAKGYLAGPLPGTRTATAGGVSVELANSTNALTRDVQKLLNGIRNNNPEVRGLGAVKNQFGIVNKQVAKQIRLDHALSHVPAAQVAVEGKYANPLTRLWTDDPKGMTKTKDHANRVVVEGVPIDERIALAERQLRAAPSNPSLANGATLKSITDPLVGEIALLNDARRYVDTVDGKPVFKPEYQEQLGSLTAGMKGLAGTRDATLIEAGVLNPEAVAAGTRANMPGRVVRGAEFQTEAQAAARIGRVKRNLTEGVNATTRLAAQQQRDLASQIRRVGLAEDKAARDLTRLLDGKTPEEAVATGRVQSTFNTMTQAYNARRAAATGVEKSAAALQRAGDQLLNALTHPNASMRAPYRIAQLTAKHTAAEKRFQAAKFAYEDARRGADQLVAQHEHAAAILGAEQKIGSGRVQAASKARLANTGMRRALQDRLAESKKAEMAALERSRALAEKFITAIERDTDRLVGAEEFTGGSFRVPYQRKPGSRALFGLGSMGSKGVVAFPAKPGSLTHSFTGDMLKSGWFRKDTTRLMVETAVEAERFAALLRDRERFIAAGHPLRNVRHGKDGKPLLDKNGNTISNEIPIRMDALKNMPFPEGVKAIIGKYENGQVLNADETAIFGRAYDTVRDAVFPKVGTIAEDVPVDGVLWVDKRILGYLDEVNPVFGAKGDKVLAFTDAVNNAERFAILYLKPSYAIPNVMGNAFLALTQQGIFAPQNIARSVRLDHRIGTKNRVFVDEAMGDGISHAISTQTGAGKNVINFAASKWGKIVDVPFRRSAFLHEAGKLGYKTQDDFTELFKNPANRQTLQEITDRATTALIDYLDLTPFERNYVRRLVFFYPWVKGSTKYAGKYLQDHPVQAMAQEQFGEKGKKDILATLGELPSFMDGVFKVYERNGMPMVINPAAASIFGTPAQVVGTLKYLAAGNFKTAELPKNFSVPLLDAVIAAATGTDPFTGNAYPSDTSGGEILFDQLTGGLPQLVLGRRLTSDQSGKLYPMNRMDSLLSFVLGVAPKPLNVGVAQGMAARGK